MDQSGEHSKNISGTWTSQDENTLTALLQSSTPSTSYQESMGMDENVKYKSYFECLGEGGQLNTEKFIEWVASTNKDDESFKKPLPCTKLPSPKPLDVKSESEEPKEDIKLFVEDFGPKWHDVKSNVVTPNIKATNLPKLFSSMPIFGNPGNGNVNDFLNSELRKYVGDEVDDKDFEELTNYCSPEHLKIGNEIFSPTNFPSCGAPNLTDINAENTPELASSELETVKRSNKRVANGLGNAYTRKLKYRGVRLLPITHEDRTDPSTTESVPDLEPGKDLLYRVRMYRPYVANCPTIKDKVRTRNLVFSWDVVLHGRQQLSDLRERMPCRNELDMRVDVSHAPDCSQTPAKVLFPSGFLFINNVFYVDRRAGRRDVSAAARGWARARGMGEFPVRDMRTRLNDIIIKLGHPEVYVHQGSCEHLFVFSSLRLLGPRDARVSRRYPAHGAVSQPQALYCTTCAEFAAAWLVRGSDRVPFDPAFVCDGCFRQYFYKDGQKIGDFKAYTYTGNQMNVLKMQATDLGNEFEDDFGDCKE